MTYVLASIAALAFSCALGKLLKRNLELNYPSVDDEGEVEDFLASRLERTLSNPGSLSPLLIEC
ncbi:hypothetical protein G9X67_34775 [Rhizobium sp. WYCCWR 11152]|uniref:hypothetical protein n=1 Tax=Rhizobium sp. WYCCWR 11152 TaxID=2692316 RepID=UPI0014920386|nr:hypothetical protein [Rhizobium sp. WYCCWR 11152]NNU70418.1 hypothetical protein [Rhizobium sp. WYCCWR 11152]